MILKTINRLTKLNEYEYKYPFFDFELYRAICIWRCKRYIRKNFDSLNITKLLEQLCHACIIYDTTKKISIDIPTVNSHNSPSPGDLEFKFDNYQLVQVNGYNSEVGDNNYFDIVIKHNTSLLNIKIDCFYLNTFSYKFESNGYIYTGVYNHNKPFAGCNPNVEYQIKCILLDTFMLVLTKIFKGTLKYKYTV